mgnify:CR=1 FL=1
MKLKLHKRVNRSLFGDVGILVFLLAFGIFMSLPLVYAINNAFKPFDELFMFPPKFFVRNPTLDNFRDMMTVLTDSQVHFSRYIFNSVFITAIGVVVQIIFTSAAAYALTKFDFPGRKFIFKMITLALMFSAAVTTVPTYILMNKFGLLDSYWAIILPAAQSTLGLYLMKQFMEQLLPDALLEAARIDGAGEARILFTIVMPIVKPAWLTLTVLSVQSLWNATGGSYIYSEQLKTLPVALSQIVAGGIARMGVGAAVSLFMMVVPITTFILSQSQMLQTMAPDN